MLIAIEPWLGQACDAMWRCQCGWWLATEFRVASGSQGKQLHCWKLQRKGPGGIKMQIELKSCESFRNALRSCGLVLKNWLTASSMEFSGLRH